jgi:hypothetical protein
MFQPDFDKTPCDPGAKKNNNFAPASPSEFVSERRDRQVLCSTLYSISGALTVPSAINEHKKWKQFLCLCAKSRAAFTLDYAFA